MNPNPYKKYAAVAVAAALLTVPFAGCNNDNNNVQSQVSDTESIQNADSDEIDDFNLVFNDTSDTPDVDGLDDEFVVLDDDYGEISQVELLEKDGFSYYVYDDKAYITEYTGSGESVTVPEKIGDFPVASLSLDIFSYSDTVKKVIIPSAVEEINSNMYNTTVESIEVSGDSKNYSSENGVLFNKDKSVLVCYPGSKSGDYVIPDTVKTVEENAFCGCPNLKSLTVSKNVKDFDGYCLSECVNLTEFKLSGGSEFYSVKDGVLYNKSGDELVLYPSGKSGDFKIPDTVKSVGAYSFAFNDKIKRAELSSELEDIGECAFANCNSLSEVKFGGKVKTIGNGAFSNCGSLAKAELPASVSSLGDYAFISCVSLKEINIPQNVSDISFDTFFYCEQLEKVSADNNNKNYAVKDNVLYDKNITTIVLYPSNRKGDYEIPDSVKSIGADVFYNCPNLTKITIPSSVEVIDSYALQNCLYLKSVEVSGDNPNYASVGGVLYNKEKTAIQYIPTAIDGEVEITAGVEEIGQELFFNVSGINGFKVDSANKSYTSEDGVLLSKDKTVLVKVPNSKKDEYNVPDGIKEIGSGAFYGCSEITSVVVAQGVENIQNNAFDCCGASAVYLPSSVKNIGMAAFGYSFNLSDIYYFGSESDWKNIFIDVDNDNLSDGMVNIHYDAM